MKFQQLLAESKARMSINPAYINGAVSSKIFDLGAKWMFEKIHEGENSVGINFISSTNYRAYGLLKYGLSLAAFFVSLFFLVKIHIFLAPASIVVFYLFEVHFLFLFPLLIDQVPNPLLSGIKQTYRIGLFTAMMTVIPIGCYMMIGLLRWRAPFRNWYTGCLAILIWYQYDVRNRL